MSAAMHGNRKDDVEQCHDIQRVCSELFDNGSKGALTKVDDHELYIQQQKGALMFIKWALGFLSITAIINFFMLIKSLAEYKK